MIFPEWSELAILHHSHKRAHPPNDSKSVSAFALGPDDLPFIYRHRHFCINLSDDQKYCPWIHRDGSYSCKNFSDKAVHLFNPLSM